MQKKAKHTDTRGYNWSKALAYEAKCRCGNVYITDCVWRRSLGWVALKDCPTCGSNMPAQARPRLDRTRFDG